MINNFSLKGKKKKLITLLCFFLFNLVSIIFINIDSLFSFSYTILLFFILSYFIIDNNFLIDNFLVFQLFLFLCLLLFIVQFSLMPEWFGFTGMYGGVGTDDSRFYASISDNIETIPWMARGYSNMDHPFSHFLRFLYPFKIENPLDIIVPNLLGIAFIPYFTFKVSRQLNLNFKTSYLAFWLVAFCPIILSNGLILMRDGWTAFLLICGIFYFIEKELSKYIIVLLMLLYLRLGTGLLLAMLPIFNLKTLFSSSNSIKNFLILSSILIGIFFGLPIIVDYLLSKGVSGFERQDFVESYIQNADSQSIIFKIYTLPIYLKLPIGLLFFLLLPFLRLEFYTDGILNIRSIMFTFIMPIVSVVYFKNFVSGVLFAFRNKDYRIIKLIYIFIGLLFVISQMSIQPRHKTSVMPIFYILVAYGIYNNDKRSNFLGFTFAILLGVIEIIFIL